MLYLHTLAVMVRMTDESEGVLSLMELSTTASDVRSLTCILS